MSSAHYRRQAKKESVSQAREGGWRPPKNEAPGRGDSPAEAVFKNDSNTAAFKARHAILQEMRAAKLTPPPSAAVRANHPDMRAPRMWFEMFDEAEAAP